MVVEGAMYQVEAKQQRAKGSDEEHVDEVGGEVAEPRAGAHGGQLLYVCSKVRGGMLLLLLLLLLAGAPGQSDVSVRFQGCPGVCRVECLLMGTYLRRNYDMPHAQARTPAGVHVPYLQCTLQCSRQAVASAEAKHQESKHSSWAARTRDAARGAAWAAWGTADWSLPTRDVRLCGGPTVQPVTVQPPPSAMSLLHAAPPPAAAAAAAAAHTAR